MPSNLENHRKFSNLPKDIKNLKALPEDIEAQFNKEFQQLSRNDETDLVRSTSLTDLNFTKKLLPHLIFSHPVLLDLNMFGYSQKSKKKLFISYPFYQKTFKLLIESEKYSDFSMILYVRQILSFLEYLNSKDCFLNVDPSHFVIDEEHQSIYLYDLTNLTFLEEKQQEQEQQDKKGKKGKKR
eukprot:Anaeramoba_ignava/c21284_g1_i1.p2 GENE.c21284_g1_i1~~c21284_g1_i1.p2  ORF type:complete len:183 (-),score=44.37 c21284_g1_i1:13-561(-)